MEFNFDIVKKHPLAVGGGLLAVFLLVYLSRRSSASSGMSGTADQLQTAQANADLTNAQANAQITGAAYQAGVVNNETAAQLALGLAQTKAEEVVALSGQQAAVTSQQIVSAADVQKTAIEGSTLVKLLQTSGQTAITLQQRKINATVAQQNYTLGVLASKGKLGGNSTGVAQILSAIQGRGPEAIAANQPAAATTAAQPGIITNSVSRFFGGLFG